MKSRSLRTVINLVLLALLSTFSSQLSTALAQGTAFTYQGRLDSGGAPANGSYDLRFGVYDSPSGGNQQGPILTNNATAISNGLFTVTLDFGNVFPGANRWLDIGVRTNGAGSFFILSPRQALTPAPYAITAGNVISGGLAAGTYGNAVTFNNPADQFTGTFTGNGANVTNVNAAKLGGLSPGNFWQLGGNTVSASQFLGSANNWPLDLWVNGARGWRLDPGLTDTSHSNAVNVVGGSSANFVAAGVSGSTISGGGALNYNGAPGTNSVASDFGVIGGGLNNGIQSAANIAVIGGGYRNTIQSGANSSAIAGGAGNIIQSNAFDCVIGGGSGNTAGAYYSAIGGGTGNFATNTYSTVVGGSANIASGSYAVAGGYNNTAAGYSSIAMGYNSHALGTLSTAMGESLATGYASTAMGLSDATGDYSTAMGHLSGASGMGSTALGTSTASGTNSTAMGNSSATNYYATAMGYQSIAGGFASTAMGFSTARGDSSTAMGESYATNYLATAMGSSTAGGQSSTSMGESTTASGDYSIAGGWYSTASGNTAVALGTSTASGDNSVALGVAIATGFVSTALGNETTASGQDSLAAGYFAQASHDGTFVWADLSQPGVHFTSTAPNQFLLRAAGGVGIGLNNPAAALHVASSSAPSPGAPQAQLTQLNSSDSARLRMNVNGYLGWEMDVSAGSSPQLQFWYVGAAGPRMTVDTSGNVYAAGIYQTSDRNAKENFQAVNARDVLDKVAALPITRWNFKEDAATPHVGPMAQDFYAAFGVGPDDKHIATVDEGGVALAAIQGLNAKVETETQTAQRQMQELKAENADLKARLEKLEKLLVR